VKGAHGPRDAELLAACYRNALTLAVHHRLVSIAFPSISTGAYGYPRDEAAKVASHAVATFLNGDATLTEVRLIFFLEADRQEFLRSQVSGQ
jgi:O-acetyl-ADP-ribose deacetylase (regulator of RNase III)